MRLASIIRAVDAAIAAHDNNVGTFGEFEELMKSLALPNATGWDRAEFRRLKAIKDVEAFSYELEAMRPTSDESAELTKRTFELFEQGCGSLLRWGTLLTTYRLPAVIIGSEPKRIWEKVAQRSAYASDVVIWGLRDESKMRMRVLGFLRRQS